MDCLISLTVREISYGFQVYLRNSEKMRDPTSCFSEDDLGISLEEVAYRAVSCFPSLIRSDLYLFLTHSPEMQEVLEEVLDPKTFPKVLSDLLSDPKVRGEIKRRALKGEGEEKLEGGLEKFLKLLSEILLRI